MVEGLTGGLEDPTREERIALHRASLDRRGFPGAAALRYGAALALYAMGEMAECELSFYRLEFYSSQD